jgi:D-alanyl-D-alanine dipeptidase
MTIHGSWNLALRARRNAWLLPLVLLMLLCFPVAPGVAQTRPEGFVDAAALVPGLVVEMRYAGADNFVGRPIAGYERPLCLLTRQAAAALAQVQQDLAARGFGLKVFDCYRPARAVAHFVRWAKDAADTARPDFYPRVDKRTLFREGYIALRSGHSRGSTVDLTLVRLADGREVDMGSPFDLFDARSALRYGDLPEAARRNRALLADAMGRRGFLAYHKEWWHYVLRGEPYPSTVFDFPIR